MNELGLTALIFLVASLACTPARWLFGWTWPIRVRRELGLFAFFYAVAPLPDLPGARPGLRPGAIILEDIAKRPFITVGFLALVLLVPLALTSTNGSVRRLGFRRWQRLHHLAYVAGVLAVVHFIWRVKIDVSQPLIYGAVLGALLLSAWRSGCGSAGRGRRRRAPKRAVRRQTSPCARGRGEAASVVPAARHQQDRHQGQQRDDGVDQEAVVVGADAGDDLGAVVELPERDGGRGCQQRRPAPASAPSSSRAS